MSNNVRDFDLEVGASKFMTYVGVDASNGASTSTGIPTMPVLHHRPPCMNERQLSRKTPDIAGWTHRAGSVFVNDRADRISSRIPVHIAEAASLGSPQKICRLTAQGNTTWKVSTLGHMVTKNAATVCASMSGCGGAVQSAMFRRHSARVPSEA